MKVDIVALRGGIDLASTLVQVPPGAALDLYNFEPRAQGGYRRIEGYERVDGRTAPSEINYYTLVVADASGISVDSDITGGTSGATARVVAKSGNTLGVTAITGTWEAGEAVGGTTVEVTPVLRGLDDMDEDSVFQLAAEDYYRGLIGAVPGDGDVLGAVQYGDTKYAFRADSTVVKLYKSSASGWTLVPFYDVLFFDGGTLSEAIEEGATVTGGTSGATGTVKRFVKNAGTYGVDASGYMVLDVTSGTFSDDENLEVIAATVCVANGSNSAITFSTGGRFEFEVHNFYGDAASKRLYGCDGVNPAFEFDGDVLTPIYFPGDEPDPDFNTPKFLIAHKQHLFLSFPGGSMAHSAIGEPLVFSALMGAADFGMGDEVTGFAERSGDILAIYTSTMTYGLQGTSTSDWALTVISETYGAEPYTAKAIGTVFAYDQKGIAPLERVDAFGGFESTTVSRLVAPLLEDKKSTIVGAVTVRGKNQYRLFFADGSAVVMTDDKYQSESLPTFSTLMFADAPTCLSNQEDANGNEVILFGSSNGYVYQMERGYNFDGEEMEYAYRSPFMSQGAPYLRKSYRRLFLDIETERNVSLNIGTELSFGSYYVATMPSKEVTINGGGGYYDVDDWDEIYWDAQVFASRGIPLTGSAKNLSVLIYGKSATTLPFTLQTLEIHYLPRRVRRGE